MRLFVDNVAHTTAKDLEHALQHPSRTSSVVKIVTDEDYFPTPEEVLQHAHQRYLESLDAPEVCYDKYRRLLKVGMSVWVDDVCDIIVGIEVLGTAQIPWLRLDHSTTLVAPCTVVLCSSTGQLR